MLIQKIYSYFRIWINKTLLVELILGTYHLQIQGKDHLTVVPDPKFHIVVKAFLNDVNKI